tara:strand:+ start:544 stop:726 length:183 start_codon:yes stop_codon:yes gene_type:complete
MELTMSIVKEKMLTLRHSDADGLKQVQDHILKEYGMHVGLQQALNFVVHKYLKELNNGNI